MAAAYIYAEGDGPVPRELEMLRLIDRFGAQAIMGRVLGVREIRRMVMAENVVNAYRARSASANWAEWARDNPELNRLLTEAMKDNASDTN